MKRDSIGYPIIRMHDVINKLYQDPENVDITNIHNFIDDPVIDQFDVGPPQRLRAYISGDNLSPDVIKVIDEEFQSQWYMPEEYKKADIRKIVKKLCNTEEERSRAHEELNEYEKRGLLPLLKYLRYLVFTMRENKIVWGVGRGSSVSSFVLYLLGVHKINSLKFNLDPKEFFK